ncbi:MAG: hypothetical protein ACO24P_00205 [Candidatus Nanopelagicaceae bacterium]
MAKRGRKPREQPLTEEEFLERRARYNATRKESRRQAAAKLRRERLEWQEIGWIVRKMNKEAGLSREEIWQLLGGLANQNKIRKWCGDNPEPR